MISQNIIKKKFILYYFENNWPDILQLDQQNVYLSIESFLNNMNLILDSNAPFKRVNKYKLRFKTNPWITPALQKSVSVKKSQLNKFIKPKDPQRKEQHHIKYKTYRNMLSILTRKSKVNDYNHYFKTNWDNIKNTCKGIKSILNINNTHSNIPKVLVSNDTTSANILQTYSTTSLHPLLLKLRKVLNIPINAFLIFLKIDLMTPFSSVPLAI